VDSTWPNIAAPRPDRELTLELRSRSADTASAGLVAIDHVMMLLLGHRGRDFGRRHYTPYPVFVLARCCLEAPPDALTNAAKCCAATRA
jgi:hypothetical protein